MFLIMSSESETEREYREEMWRLLCDISFCGDNDEGISKHIIHALTAICLGMTWEECLDYTGLKSFNSENKARLAPLWEQVQNIANELGIEEFYNMLKEERFERWTWGRIPMYAQDHHRCNKVEVPEWLKDTP